MNYEQLLSDLERDEGLRLKPYQCPAGKLTIGVGRNIEDIGITEDEARYLLVNDVKRVEAEFDRNMPWWRDMPEQAQQALVNMGFNLGWPRLSMFKKMLSALQRGDYGVAALEAVDSKWARQVGQRAWRIAEQFKTHRETA
jgi:lysozyme